MSMSLKEADVFLSQRRDLNSLKMSVDRYVLLTAELLDAAGFDPLAHGTVVQVIINPWSLEVILLADKDDEGAYRCDKDSCWLKSVTVEIDNKPHNYNRSNNEEVLKT